MSSKDVYYYPTDYRQYNARVGCVWVISTVMDEMGWTVAGEPKSEAVSNLEQLMSMMGTWTSYLSYCSLLDGTGFITREKCFSKDRPAEHSL